MTSGNVNFNCPRAPEVNVKLGQEMRKILLFLYKDREHVHHQVEIIKALHGKVTPSRKASVSRAIKTLKKAGLVDSRKAYYSEIFKAWIVQRVCFFITELGEEFVRARFLEASP